MVGGTFQISVCGIDRSWNQPRGDRSLFVRIELIDGYLKGKAQYVMDVIRKGIAIYVSLILMYSGYGLIEIGGYQISPAREFQ